MIDRERFAIEAHRLGHRLVLLKEGTKSQPLHKDFPNRELDESEVSFAIRRWNANWGTLLRGLVLADRDRSSRDGYNLLRKTGLFYSPMAVLSRRGPHLYARLPEGTEVTSKINAGKLGFDLLTGNRFGVGPGSVVDGHTYGIRGEIVPPDELPEVNPELVTLMTRETRHRVQTVVECPIEWAMKRVESFDRSEQGKNGSTACFIAALKCLSMTGGDMAKAWELLVLFNRTRCSPMWCEESEQGPDSLRKKLRDAAKVWRPR